MKTMLLLLLAAGSLAAAQSVVPVEKEPQHHLVFENAYVKVLEVTLPPGYVTLSHQHSQDNLGIRVTSGRTRTDQLTAEGTPRDVPAGTVSFFSGTPPYTHRVANVGTTVVRIVDVELPVAKAIADSRSADDRAGHTIVLENDRARVSRIQLSPGDSLPSHTHQRGWLEVVIAGPRPGQFTWHAAGSRTAAPGSPSTPTEVVEVEPK